MSCSTIRKSLLCEKKLFRVNKAWGKKLKINMKYQKLPTHAQTLEKDNI